MFGIVVFSLLQASLAANCWADCYRDESEIKRDPTGCPYKEQNFPISWCSERDNGCENHCKAQASDAEKTEQQKCKATCEKDGWGMVGVYVGWNSCDRYCIDTRMSSTYVSPNARGVDEFYPDVDALPIARGMGSSCQQHDDCLTGNCYNGKCAAPRRGRGAGMYEECETDGDCNPGLMCNRWDECVLDGRSVALPSARGMGSSCQQHDDCLTGNCYNGKCAAPRRGRGAGMYEECETDGDCNPGLMCNRWDECVLDGRSVGTENKGNWARAIVDRLARKEEERVARTTCCQGSTCYNYPMHDFFTCQNKGGKISRSVDSGVMACKNACYDQIGKLSRQDFKDCLGNCEENIARSVDSPRHGRKVQDWGACEASSDCESGRCRRDWDEWKCHPARSVDSERFERGTPFTRGDKYGDRRFPSMDCYRDCVSQGHKTATCASTCGYGR